MGNGNTSGYPFTTSEVYRAMVPIADVAIIGSGSNGVFIAGRTVTLSAYQIAKYETTYELWHEVKTWATNPDNGYKFNGAAPISAANTEPVTCVSWRDVIVWCNAYSEMTGRTPAYYSDAACTTVIKSLSDDTVYVKSGASGYRLPTEAEWEAAARGGDPSAPAWSYTCAGSDTPGSVAVYAGNQVAHIAPVGSKAANSAGLYDMTGNVWEWCWDWYGSIGAGPAVNPTGAAPASYRVSRGGSWFSDASDCAVARRIYGISAPGGRYGILGFRVVCAPLSKA